MPLVRVPAELPDRVAVLALRRLLPRRVDTGATPAGGTLCVKMDETVSTQVISVEGETG